MKETSTVARETFRGRRSFGACRKFTRSRTTTLGSRRRESSRRDSPTSTA
jgi:hypothetical protein